MKALTAFAALCCLGLGLPETASASCFFVFSGNQLIYRSTRSPIDLSKAIHTGMVGRFAGAHLTMIPDERGCPELLTNGISDTFATSGTNAPRSAIDASPLFRGGTGVPNDPPPTGTTSTGASDMSEAPSATQNVNAPRRLANRRDGT